MFNLLIGGVVAVVVLGGIGVFLLACGALYLYLNQQTQRQYQALLTWPSTPGQIRSAEVARTSSLTPSGRLTYSYNPAISYAFTVGGTEYVGHHIDLSGIGGRVTSQEYVDQHPPGSAVTVYYNPAKPTQAYLDRSSDPNSLLAVVIGAGSLAAGGVFLLVMCLVGVWLLSVVVFH